ncbi:MAG TPA: DUF5989 family protein [Longimicrobiaceae bacterium]|nr:DUF5989 family protein [Longimicrobiaceae bacterium]
MPALRRLSARLQVLRELAAFLRERRLWWLLPMLFVVLSVGVLLALAQGSVLAPFIYTLF